MRVITFNTQGIEQAADRGFFDWMIHQDADVVCLQDLRAKDYQLDGDRYHPEGYNTYFFDAFEDGYSGVAIYCRQVPKAIMTGLGFELCDFHGRFIQADFDKVSVSSLHIPSGLKSHEAQLTKDEFLSHFMGHLKKTLRKRRDFIFCGTFNTAHRTIDLSNWYANQTVSGFLPSERAWMEEMLGELGYIDAFREVNKADRQYTWWPDYNRARSLNEGARLDYQITTAGLRKTVKSVQIYKDEMFSEHAPLIIDYEGDF
ncbi:exodeoxyribonuclease III [Neptunomonas phycophila]|jgi:exodeoxyribonuclease-3|uniref:Exodeoxyribonuclease III n=1 Tax=Neptunomonas phycophila TaxID=1572645 RepID=A0AAW7XGL0_9GAMM|nr:MULTISPECIES: exodeoxyribonuclease III [Neptunomonas]MBT3145093.1 exodeoxyribonuclease III [Neptunomonas phycophila]MDN2659355.1 exodeoxyribonuclease III [Neptunomonas sp. CHC150]MDO6453351.1 exodeoxyribonuclease III [Neptunomonas phycophila]MDO6468502.1 exodeoxyribonuclease III [Neptunomonas phycophila]MDO6784952.1 exodeoxyribonuclease III [Neptunomonas phycophila]